MAEGKILPYLDIPFQHASLSVLKAMKRPAATEKTLDRIRTWRELCPDITLRSTFIVGFPGETDADFEELLQFLQIAQLDRVGCFQYSPVDGAAANDLDNHVPEELKQERWERFMETQQEISTQKLQAKIGQKLEVLVDEANAEGIVARSAADAPEIDGNVFLEPNPEVEAGDFIQVKIHDADEYDLYGVFAD
jgi:ribosomal protein S12 methylthiotransferase